jgi:hypothetical protein
MNPFCSKKALDGACCKTEAGICLGILLFVMKGWTKIYSSDSLLLDSTINTLEIKFLAF